MVGHVGRIAAQMWYRLHSNVGRMMPPSEVQSRVRGKMSRWVRSRKSKDEIRIEMGVGDKMRI